jgi:hypothetical protein
VGREDFLGQAELVKVRATVLTSGFRKLQETPNTPGVSWSLGDPETPSSLRPGQDVKPGVGSGQSWELGSD